MEPNSVHNLLKPFTMSLQIMGMSSQENGHSAQNQSNSKWKPLKYLCTVVLLAIFILLSLSQMYDNFWKSDYNITASGSYLFQVTTILLFSRLAKSWPHLMKSWDDLDTYFNVNYHYQKKLINELHLIRVIYVIAVLGEFTIHCTTVIIDLKIEHKDQATHSFIIQQIYPNVFDFIPYNFLLACILWVLIPAGLFLLSINDLLIVTLSFPLSSRFQQLTKKLEQSKHKVTISKNFWFEIRNDYNYLCNFCADLDDSISGITLLSFASNIYMLLLYIFYLIQFRAFNYRTFAFIYSLVFIIVRILAVILFPAQIYEESKKPITILNATSFNHYHVQIHWWLQQIKLDSVALTGNKMFRITRDLIIKIGGALISYELIIIQCYVSTKM